MEYGKIINEAESFQPVELRDSNYFRFVGYQENNACIEDYFSPNTIRNISHKITELLQGVDPKGRPIIVPNATITSIMSNVYQSFRPETGDIYSRYIIPKKTQANHVQNMINQVIEIITSQIRNEIGILENNAKLTAWTIVYGNFNKHGLTQTPQIKTLKRRPDPMLFQMNY